MPSKHRYLIVFALLSSIVPPAMGRPAECKAAKLAAKYARMQREDQALRGRYIELLEKEHARVRIDAAEKERLETSISETDEKNRIELGKLIETCGWPGSLDRKRAAFSAFLIVQHAPLPYQLQYLPTIEAANARGDISNEHLAWLIDRILVRQGKPQRYGTEFEYGSNKVFPVEDGKNLNKRRKKMGLPPMKGYP